MGSGITVVSGMHVCQLHCTEGLSICAEGQWASYTCASILLVHNVVAQASFSLWYSAHVGLHLQVHLVVATPKRLAHLVKAKQIDLSSVQFLVLDEADKLFESGFVSHIDAIIHACSNPGIVSILPVQSITPVLYSSSSAVVLITA